jgi:hypothetical protein
MIIRVGFQKNNFLGERKPSIVKQTWNLLDKKIRFPKSDDFVFTQSNIIAVLLTGDLWNAGAGTKHNNSVDLQ